MAATSKEAKGVLAFISIITLFIQVIAIFPAWVYVMRSVLIRGEATDLEWIVFYGYCAANVFMACVSTFLRAFIETAD